MNASNRDHLGETKRPTEERAARTIKEKQRVPLSESQKLSAMFAFRQQLIDMEKSFPDPQTRRKAALQLRKEASKYFTPEEMLTMSAEAAITLSLNSNPKTPKRIENTEWGMMLFHEDNPFYLHVTPIEGNTVKMELNQREKTQLDIEVGQDLFSPSTGEPGPQLPGILEKGLQDL